MTQSMKDDTQMPLHYLLREPKLRTGSHRGIILLHGVGSNEEDLFRFSQSLPDDFYVVSPRAPYSLGVGRYAWYNVDFSTGRPVINHSEEESSRRILLDFIRLVKQRYDLQEVYVGGFSQGGIMSYTLGLTHPDEISGLLSLSGRLLNEVKPLVNKGESLHRLKVFISHGINDETLPVSYAREAKEYLADLDVQVSYHEYPIGHQISNEVLNDIIKWI